MGEKNKKLKSLYTASLNGKIHKIMKKETIPEYAIIDPYWGVAIPNVQALMKYGIYLTNNGCKMHGQPMTRRVAGRKGVRKHK